MYFIYSKNPKIIRAASLNHVYNEIRGKKSDTFGLENF